MKRMSFRVKHININSLRAIPFLIIILSACDGIENKTVIGTPKSVNNSAMKNYQLTKTEQIIVTSEAGDKLAIKNNVTFHKASEIGHKVIVKPEIIKQTMTGVGTSFTESSAFVLAHLDKQDRQHVMNNIYGQDGANFSLARTHIGATDFAVKGKYSYAETANDLELKHFTIAPDKAGFSNQKYPNIKDVSYDLLPMIQEANEIKKRQGDEPINIIASAWTAPPWMKDIEDYYQRGTEATGMEGTGGELKPEFVGTYAEYLIKYLNAYKQEGVDIWGLTPINEPNGNSGQWESMHFSPETQKQFITKHLGPQLHNSDYTDIRLLIYDQNRDHMEEWADTILSDKEASQYVYGTAVHWYESTERVYDDILDKVHNKYPSFDIINTEATIDDLGKPASGGVLDVDKFQEKSWFNNDEFWWNKNATDWAYTATWAPHSEDHPIYTPVHRYARNIIVSFNHWMSGWIDWNIVLDAQGGPNHVGNYCGAPIMIDTATGQIYYTPIYYVLAQFSKSIRPGDKALQTEKYLATDRNSVNVINDDALHASATINSDNLISVQLLNTTKKALSYQLQVGTQSATVEIPANAVQTVQFTIDL